MKTDEMDTPDSGVPHARAEGSKWSDRTQDPVSTVPGEGSKLVESEMMRWVRFVIPVRYLELPHPL